MLVKLGDAAGVFEFNGLGFAGFGVGGALVGERDNKALVKKSQLAQPLRQRIEIVFRRQ